MRRRCSTVVLVVLTVASVLVPVPVGAQPSSSSFDAVGRYGQISVTGGEPGAEVALGRWLVDGEQLGLELVERTALDDFGSIVFRGLDAGLYIAVTPGAIDWVITVTDVDAPPPPASFYEEQTLAPGLQYIETRDGTLLSAHVVLPGPVDEGPYPTVVEYSGYDPSNPTSGGPAQPGSLIASLLGYAIVGVNVRGTGCSGGSYDFFERMQVLDGYDVIETVAAQPWVAHGEVGMVGLSYPGIAQLFVAGSRPPSLAAITPLSVYGDTATGVLSPGGLLNTGFATQWADNVLDDATAYGTAWVRQRVDEGDEVCDANQQLRLQNVDATAKARANPYYTDEVAGPLDLREVAPVVDVPVFLASAWQDEQTGPSFGDLLGRFDSSPSVRATVYNGLHADGFAPQVLAEWAAFLDLYVAREVPSIPGLVRLAAPVFFQDVFGGRVELPPDRWTDVADHAEALQRWESEPEIRVLFDSGAGGDPGLPIAAWEASADQWPPAGVVATRLFLGADGTLGEERTRDRPGTAVAFRPDPAVATTSFHTSGEIWFADQMWDWVPQADGDNARFQTAPLVDDVVMAGPASVDLWLRTDATDAEIEVVVSEVRPDGQELRVQAGQLQASYRALDDSSTELQPVQYGREDTWAPLVPDRWTEVRVQIPSFAHAFRAGSSIRLTVNTPGGDTARWEFELDGPGAEATHLISTGVNRPSSVVLPVVEGWAPSTPPPPCRLRGQPCRPTPAIANEVVRVTGNGGANG